MLFAFIQQRVYVPIDLVVDLYPVVLERDRLRFSRIVRTVYVLCDFFDCAWWTDWYTLLFHFFFVDLYVTVRQQLLSLVVEDLLVPLTLNFVKIGNVV